MAMRNDTTQRGAVSVIFAASVSGTAGQLRNLFIPIMPVIDAELRFSVTYSARNRGQ